VDWSSAAAKLSRSGALTHREPEAAFDGRMGQHSGSLQVLKELIEAGKITPIVDRTYSLSETPDAIRYQQSGHAVGKVVISV
jgi:NADPH:quinone reductase-like Zn-dependent oxidoreductase